VNSVKNTLHDLQKHIKGESSGSEKNDEEVQSIPVFKVYTQVEQGEKGMNVVHEPSAEDLKVGLEEFIHTIGSVSKVIPRLESVFRQKRDLNILEIKKQIMSQDSGGGF